MLDKLDWGPQMNLRSVALATVTCIALLGCVANDPQRAIEANAVMKLTAAGKIKHEEEERRLYAIDAKYRTLDSYDLAFWSTAISAGEQYDKKRISMNQYLAIRQEAWARNIERTNADKARRRSISCYTAGNRTYCS
jgi:hypothetical protein